MTSQNFRRALLGSAISAVAGTAMVGFAAPASAQCVVAPNSVTCATTVTTDTTNAGTTPASDRHYPVDTSAAAFTGTVSSGATVSGNGLAFTNTVPGTNALNVVNNGTVQVNTGLTPLQGGSAALEVNAIGATPVNYSGAGDIIHLGTGNGLDIETVGTGAIVATVGGNVTTSAPSSIGVRAVNSGTAGSVQVTTTAGRTIRAGSVGVYGAITDVANAGTLTVTNNATVGSPVAAPNTLTNGVLGVSFGTGAVTVANTGAIGSATDRIANRAVSGSILNATSAATLAVTNGAGPVYGATGVYAENSGTGVTNVTTGTGIVNGVDFGIDANATGTGNLTVQTGTGAVTASAVTGNAIDASATSGALTVNVGGVATGGANGIVASNTGTQSILVGGNVTGTAGSGISSTTTGGRTITISSGRTVAGGTQAILLNGSGTTTIGNGGTIGTASTGLALNAATAGAVTLNNNSTGTVNGRLMFSAGNDSFANQGLFTTQGTTDFGLGADTLTNTGTITLTGATAFTGLETFNQSGRINLGTYTLTGTGPFNNLAGGYIDTAGTGAGLAGFTSFSNAGTLDLAAGTFIAPTGAFTNSGLILADEGSSTITGQTSFTNSGTIDLQDGVADDILTINSSFVGTGGSTLMLDVDDDVADELVIAGAASGSTSIEANLVGSGILIPDGVLLVDAGTSTADAFVLGSVTGNVSPILNYDLEQRAADYYLVTSLNDVAFTPVPIGLIGGEMWYQSADAVIAQMKLPSDGTGRMGLWGQVYFGREKSGGMDTSTVGGVDYEVDNKVRTDRVGFQAGAGFGLGGGVIGVTAGVAESDSTTDSNDYEASGWNLGAYGMFGGPVGIHGSVLAKHDRFNIDVGSGVFENLGPDGRSNGIDGEVGYRFGGGTGMGFDVSAGLAHVRTKIDDIELAGVEYDYGRMTSTRGRFGVRATGSGPISPFVDARVYHEFSDDHDVILSDGIDAYSLSANGRGTWARIEAGVGGPASGIAPMVAAWVDLGDVKGVGARGSFRF